MQEPGAILLSVDRQVYQARDDQTGGASHQVQRPVHFCLLHGRNYILYVAKIIGLLFDARVIDKCVRSETACRRPETRLPAVSRLRRA